MPSAHSDVADELIRSARSLAGVSHYCPDPNRYAFVLLHLQDFSIFGLAYGQSVLGYRLPEGRIAEALHEGGSPALELGRSWVVFKPWSNYEPLEASRRRLARWCAIGMGFAPDTDAA
jgi:hypothetical protein